MCLSVESKCHQHHCLTQTLYLQFAIQRHKHIQTQLAYMHQQNTLVRIYKLQNKGTLLIGLALGLGYLSVA